MIRFACHSLTLGVTLLAGQAAAEILNPRDVIKSVRAGLAEPAKQESKAGVAEAPRQDTAVEHRPAAETRRNHPAKVKRAVSPKQSKKLMKGMDNTRRALGLSSGPEAVPVSGKARAGGGRVATIVSEARNSKPATSSAKTTAVPGPGGPVSNSADAAQLAKWTARGASVGAAVGFGVTLVGGLAVTWPVWPALAPEVFLGAYLIGVHGGVLGAVVGATAYIFSNPDRPGGTRSTAPILPGGQ